MPTLKNARHERFAQEMAKGAAASQAYVTAGYSPNEGNSIRLKGNDKVAARIAELQGRAAERAVVTTESLVLEADEIQRKAVKAGQFSAAIGALTAKAKIAGKWVERSEAGKPGDFERMTDDELADFIQSEAAALGVGDAGAKAPGGKARVRGEPGGLH